MSKGEMAVEIEKEEPKSVQRSIIPNKTKTKIIQRKNGVLLVEWMYSRAWVTPDMIVSQDDEIAHVINPSAGIPYGVDFAQIINEIGMEASPENIDREFKRRGIWTIADLRARPQEAVSAIQAAYRMDLGRVLQAAKAYEDGML